MFRHLSAVTILAVALWMLLEISFTTGQTLYRLSQARLSRPMKLPQLRNGLECPSLYFPNGVAKLRHRNTMVRFTCSSGFTLVGNMYTMCEKGRWDAAVPICIRSGCPELTAFDNGQISYEYKQAVGMLFCNSGYQVAGPAKTYCNGTHWDRPLGSCRETGIPVETSCDFEAADFCGWMNEATHDFDWIRSDGVLSPEALKTGPKFDHTSMLPLAGHFLMVDSSQQLTNETARLMSPLYPANYSTDACFLFYYHMFGDNVGTLSVYMKPVSKQLDSLTANDALFSLRGNQRNVWNEGYFDLKQCSEDFQIIIEASLGMKFKSDIAIDDVSLLNGGDCRPKSDGEGQQEASSDTLENASPEKPLVEDNFKIDSCDNRCGKSVSTVVVIGKQNLIHCDCIEGCVETKTCCSDYAKHCVYNDNSDSKIIESCSTTPSTIQTSTTPDPTSTTTTVKATPSTTPSTTSTTTLRTMSSTTTQPTTTNPTTTTTTSTTTKQPTTTYSSSTAISTTLEIPIDEDIFMINSCENRCGQNVPTIAVIGKQNFIHCDCSESCVEINTCCFDYAERCMYNDNIDLRDIESSSTTSSTTPMSTTPTSTSTITSMKTTSAATPTTTSMTTPHTTLYITMKPTATNPITITTTSTATQRPTTTSSSSIITSATTEVSMDEDIFMTD